MRVQILSDLHLEFGETELDFNNVELVRRK